MGTYINKGNNGFKGAIADEYVDKSGLIAVINKTLGTERRYSCVTRCRRFGKSMALDMLCAYYDKSCDSRSLFRNLTIEKDDTFEEHLNKYLVLYLDVTDFTTRYLNDKSIIKHIQEQIIAELLDVYPEVKRVGDDDLMCLLSKIANLTGDRFIMLIDEWDAICREYDKDPAVMDEYVNLLRRLFKGSLSKDVFAGVYMTGILPIKKYNTQSALNNFREYSMTRPNQLASYFGFTLSEVEALAAKHDFDLEALKSWYDGYQIGQEPSMFNPFSVMGALNDGACSSYWSTTGAYDSVSRYIRMNFDGLKDDIIKMLAGGQCRVNTTKFQNDLSIITCKDDVLTVLIHLGYLAYNPDKAMCYIPNKEVGIEMTNAVEATDWTRLVATLEASAQLLDDTLDGNEEAVARGIDLAHDENTSILSYNNENSLACVLSIAYLFAKNDYIIHRELPTDKGFADLVLIPRRNVEGPALVVELKYNKDADAAIDQIKRKQYPAKIADYLSPSGKGQYEPSLLLVGINYGKQTKTHSCKIERLEFS